MLIELQDLFDELRDEWKANNSDVWTNLTLKLDYTGKFSIDYDYENVIESTLDDYQRQMIWEYTNLVISPMDKEDEESIKNYLN